MGSRRCVVASLAIGCTRRRRQTRRYVLVEYVILVDLMFATLAVLARCCAQLHNIQRLLDALNSSSSSASLISASDVRLFEALYQRVWRRHFVSIIDRLIVELERRVDDDDDVDDDVGATWLATSRGFWRYVEALLAALATALERRALRKLLQLLALAGCARDNDANDDVDVGRNLLSASDRRFVDIVRLAPPR